MDPFELEALREAEKAERNRYEDEARRAVELEEHPVTSWDAAAWPESLELEHPGMLRRTDGRALLYAGKTHSFVGEPESGKSWLALAAAQEVIGGGGGVLYVDFEDSAKAVIRRLLAIGVAEKAARARFAYVHPEVPLRGVAERYSIARTGRRYAPQLVVIDGVTECMSLHGWDINSATDVAAFLATFPRLWEQTGAAVVMIDHVVKSRDERARWAVGSQHKLAGVNGASYTFEVTEPYGRGRTGRATVGVAKDREGAVREWAHEGKVAGTFVLEGGEDGSVGWRLEPYDDGAVLRSLGDKILEVLAEAGEPMPKSAVAKATGRKQNDVWAALGELEMRGAVRITAGPHNAKLVELV